MYRKASTIFFNLIDNSLRNRPLFQELDYFYTWEDVKYKASEIFEHIAELKQNQSELEKVLIVSDNTFFVLSSFISCWCLELIPIMPNGLKYENYENILNDKLCILLENSETSAGLPSGISQHLIKLSPRKSNNPLNLDFIKAVKYIADEPSRELAKTIIQMTSGSTGTPKAISRTLDSLYRENYTLYDLILKKIEDVDDLKLISTVPNFHAYGIEFRFLLPILNNICSYNQMIIYQEQLKKFDDTEKYILITSPGFLKRLDSSENKLNIKQTVSAGGKLNERAFQVVRNYFGKPIIDILGSTETGVMAYRITMTSDKYMHPNGSNTFYVLNGNNILMHEGSGRLALESDYIPNEFKLNIPDTKGELHAVFVSEDLIELNSNQNLRVLGRTSRVIKIEDNRVSLDDIEKALLDLDFISECAVVPSYDSARECTVAMLVLSDQGNCFLKNNSKGKLLMHIRKSLHGIIQIALPRKILIVNEIPQTPNGKTDYQRIKESFGNEVPNH